MEGAPIADATVESNDSDDDLAAALEAELEGSSDDEHESGDRASLALARRLQQAEDEALARQIAAEQDVMGTMGTRRSPRRGEVQLSQLPPEIMAKVITFVPYVSLKTLQRVSRELAVPAAAESRCRTRRRLHDALQAGFAADFAARGDARAAAAARDTSAPDLSTSAAACEPAQLDVASTRASSSCRADVTGSSFAGIPTADELPSWDSISKAAGALEEALVELGSRSYGSKCRQLLFNLADPKNPTLRARLLAGEITPQSLVRLSGREMAGTELQSQRLAWKECALQRVVRPDWRAGGFVCDLYRCGSCDCAQAKMHRTIRAGKRAVDEVSTLYATCIMCGNRWAVDGA